MNPREEPFFMPHSDVFPFSALVGQDKMKLGLILNVIDPSIDGVLIRGERGTAKSTAVRGLARLLPEIAVVADCAVGCRPDRPSEFCPECAKRTEEGEELSVSSRKMRVVDLPVGATEDRVVGSLDMEKALTEGKMRFEPGILGRVNRGFLYVDEVNLLEDHIVDVLLDSAAMGVNRIEREGVSYAHPSRFVLVGTMNPEEGDLRPQLLDRFGLCVDVEGIRDPEMRVEVIRRRRDYEHDSLAFAARWREADAELAQAILDAESLLARVAVDDETLEVIAALSVDVGADGHRADLAMTKAVAALAALHGRTEVSDEDIRAAAGLVYPHRMKKSALEERILSEEEIVTSIRKSREEQAERRANPPKKKVI
jgi:Mg-chelatase subunit ChlI